MSSFNMCCERCGRQAGTSIVSRFNLQVICLNCSDKERAHPRYSDAVAAEEEQIRIGNLNFRGIGKPSDL